MPRACGSVLCMSVVYNNCMWFIYVHKIISMSSVSMHNAMYVTCTSTVYAFKQYILHLRHIHTHTHNHTDKLDAIRSFRKRKRLHSDVEENEELSLMEYITKKQRQEERGGENSGTQKKKRVSSCICTKRLPSFKMIALKENS